MANANTLLALLNQCNDRSKVSLGYVEKGKAVKRDVIKAIFGTVLIIIGMTGIYFKVEYSGWIIFLGALVIL